MKPSLMILALLTAAALVEPQTAPRVVKIGEVSGDVLGPGETAALRALIISYITERGGFRIVDAEGVRIALEEASADAEAVVPLSADYVLTAKTFALGERTSLALDLTKVATTERKSVSESYASMNDLLAGAKNLAADLFNRAFGPTSPASNEGRAFQISLDQNPTLSAVAGTWDGDKGIHSITLRSDGRGFALLDSGVRMMLKAVISGTQIVVTQDQPNSPDFYRPDLDLKSAAIVSAAARRWKWIFSLTADGRALIGYKESVFVKVDENGSVSVDNDYSREALWTRRSR
jgi:hypothetical protein